MLSKFYTLYTQIKLDVIAKKIRKRSKHNGITVFPTQLSFNQVQLTKTYLGMKQGGFWQVSKFVSVRTNFSINRLNTAIYNKCMRQVLLSSFARIG